MSNNNNSNDYNERERRVSEIYDQGKNTREIAKDLRMSLRDIGFLKKGQVNHGIVTIMDNGNNSNSNNNIPANEKAIQDYKLFSRGKKPLEVVIELCNRETQVNKLFRAVEVKASV